MKSERACSHVDLLELLVVFAPFEVPFEVPLPLPLPLLLSLVLETGSPASQEVHMVESMQNCKEKGVGNAYGWKDWIKLG